MLEKAVSFGPDDNLFGVISEPTGNNIKINAPAVIILNAGLLHKVGPYRLNVDLAREIAEKGFYVIRFDLSGIGDSRSNPKNGTRWDMATKDVRQSMKLLSRLYGHNKFILVGLCSGSDNAHRISLSDERVIGTVHLDGFSFKNLWYYIHYFGPRLLSFNTVKKKLLDLTKAILRKIFKSKINEQFTPLELASLNRDFPTKKQAQEDFRLLVTRGVKLLYVYNGMGQRYNSYKNQLRDSLKVDFLNYLDLEFYLFSLHTYDSIHSRRLVIKRVSEWIYNNFSLKL